MPEQTPEARAREQQREFRRIIADAVGALRSEEIRTSYASVSLEELIDQHITKLEGGDSINVSRLQRIRKIKEDLDSHIEAIKEINPSDFRRHDPTGDANTAPETTDE